MKDKFIDLFARAVGPQGPIGATGPAFSANTQVICVEGGKRALVHWGTCAATDVSGGTEVTIYKP